VLSHGLARLRANTPIVRQCRRRAPKDYKAHCSQYGVETEALRLCMDRARPKANQDMRGCTARCWRSQQAGGRATEANWPLTVGVCFLDIVLSLVNPNQELTLRPPARVLDSNFKMRCDAAQRAPCPRVPSSAPLCRQPSANSPFTASGQPCSQQLLAGGGRVSRPG
jgi:hypothetical protein